MLDGINVQDGKISEIDKRAVWNKAIQIGILQKLLLWKMLLPGNFPKLINGQDGIRVCRLEFFKTIINCAALLLDRLGYKVPSLIESQMNLDFWESKTHLSLRLIRQKFYLIIIRSFDNDLHIIIKWKFFRSLWGSVQPPKVVPIIMNNPVVDMFTK